MDCLLPVVIGALVQLPLSSGDSKRLCYLIMLTGWEPRRPRRVGPALPVDRLGGISSISPSEESQAQPSSEEKGLQGGERLLEPRRDHRAAFRPHNTALQVLQRPVT